MALSVTGRVLLDTNVFIDYLRDGRGPANDLLIALTAWHAGAAVVTNNVREFQRIAGWLPGLSVVAPIGEGV